MSVFHSLEVVGCVSEAQLQVCENLNERAILPLPIWLVGW